MKTESLSIGVKWDFLNISITGNGVVDNVGPIEKVKKVKRVDFPVKDYLEQYYDKNFYLSIEEYFGAFEELEIPFLDNPVFHLNLILIVQILHACNLSFFCIS